MVNNSVYFQRIISALHKHTDQQACITKALASLVVVAAHYTNLTFLVLY